MRERGREGKRKGGSERGRGEGRRRGVMERVTEGGRGREGGSE